MSRTRIVKGNITEITGGNYKVYSKEDIENIGSKVIQVGKEDGVSYGEPEKYIVKDDKIKREIYLTFDDGIQAGTEEVLQLLKEKGIKGTFFLTGVHLWYAFSYYPEKAKKILKDIYENHIIGNHSYSHANDHYGSFYRDCGVLIDNKEKRMNVVNDFEKCKNQINYYLGQIYNKDFSKLKFPLAKNQKKAFARFPGTNTWYVSSELKDIANTNRNRTIEIKGHKSPIPQIPKKDTKEEANALYNQGYKIFGWDTEWSMFFDFHNDAIKDEEKRKEKGTMDYSKWEISHPFYEMYSKENISKDRVKETWETIRNKLLDMAYYGGGWDESGKTKGKAVLLMHERAFRKGELINGKVDLSKNSELDKLGKFIDYFLQIKAEFKTLEDY